MNVLYVVSVLLNIILCANCFMLAKELSKAEKLLDRANELLEETKNE